MEDNKQQQPLVSVAVITYNSSATVLETLDSIYNQTYPNIELIISDDCSTDNTLDVCRKWLSTHERRFSSTRIIVPEANTGVTGNCQRVWESCDTEWLKYIAGDDILLPNCITDNIEYVSHHPSAMLVFSKAVVFGLPTEDIERYLLKYDYTFFNLSAEKQYEKLLLWCSFPITTAFINRKELYAKGIKYDLRIPFSEERPFFLRISSKGIKFEFFAKETVKYRLRRDSLSNAKIDSPKFYESIQLSHYYYNFEYLSKKSQEEAIQHMMERDMRIYNEYYDLKMESMTKSYKIYKYFSHPSHIFTRIKKCFVKRNY